MLLTKIYSPLQKLKNGHGQGLSMLKCLTWRFSSLHDWNVLFKITKSLESFLYLYDWSTLIVIHSCTNDSFRSDKYIFSWTKIERFCKRNKSNYQNLLFFSHPIKVCGTLCAWRSNNLHFISIELFISNFPLSDIVDIPNNWRISFLYIWFAQF